MENESISIFDYMAEQNFKMVIKLAWKHRKISDIREIIKVAIENLRNGAR